MQENVKKSKKKTCKQTLPQNNISGKSDDAVIVQNPFHVWRKN